MDLAGVRLIYATAQPMTQMQAGAAAVYVFHAQDVVAREFSFDARGIAAISSASGKVSQDSASGRFTIKDLQAGTNGLIDIGTPSGAEVRLLILTQRPGDR